MIGKVAVSAPHTATTKDVASAEAVTRIWSAAAKEVQADAPAVQARRLQMIKQDNDDWEWAILLMHHIVLWITGKRSGT
jgi:hypothetical protein